jgi:hypothetical protein
MIRLTIFALMLWPLGVSADNFVLDNKNEMECEASNLPHLSPPLIWTQVNCTSSTWVVNYDTNEVFNCVARIHQFCGPASAGGGMTCEGNTSSGQCYKLLTDVTQSSSQKIDSWNASTSHLPYYNVLSHPTFAVWMSQKNKWAVRACLMAAGPDPVFGGDCVDIQEPGHGVPTLGAQPSTVTITRGGTTTGNP